MKSDSAPDAAPGQHSIADEGHAAGVVGGAEVNGRLVGDLTSEEILAVFPSAALDERKVAGRAPFTAFAGTAVVP